MTAATPPSTGELAGVVALLIALGIDPNDYRLGAVAAQVVTTVVPYELPSALIERCRYSARMMGVSL